MYHDIEEKLAVQGGTPYTGRWLCGLPLGLDLSNGVIVGET